jgi:perosamine synthetase
MPESSKPTIDFPTWPQLSDEDITAVVGVLKTSKLSQLSSPAVADFEGKLAAYIGTRHAVAVNSGTAAVHAALAALDIGPGHEVLVPSHTFIGSAAPIIYQGAEPVFVDVDDQTYCLDPASVRQSITPRTKAIIAVHLNGATAPMDEIAVIASEHGITMIEDVAQAIGASHSGRRLGSIGHLAAFSFWEDKIVTAGGEGGAVLTDDDALAERMRRFRHHGEYRPAGARVYSSIDIGHNYRLTAMQAALATSQMNRLDSFLAERQRNARELTKRLIAVPGLQVPQESSIAAHACWKYVCRVPDQDEDGIDQLTLRLRDRGVPAFRRYPVPLHRQLAFTKLGFGGQTCPVSDRLATELFSLPIHPLISAHHIKFMADTIAAVMPEFV